MVVGKFHRVQRKAVGDGRDRVGLGFRLQLFGGQAVVLLGHVVHVGFQVFVLDLGQRKAHLHVVAGGGLDLVAFAVQHLDVEGVGGGHVLVLVPHVLDGFAGLVAKVPGDPLHRQGRPVRERPCLGPHRHGDVADGLGLFKGRGFRGFLQRVFHRLGLFRLQHHADVLGQLGFNHLEGDAFKAHIALRGRGIGILAGEEQVGAVLLRRDGLLRRVFPGNRGPDRNHGVLRRRFKDDADRQRFLHLQLQLDRLITLCGQPALVALPGQVRRGHLYFSQQDVPRFPFQLQIQLEIRDVKTVAGDIRDVGQLNVRHAFDLDWLREHAAWNGEYQRHRQAKSLLHDILHRITLLYGNICSHL